MIVHDRSRIRLASRPPRHWSRWTGKLFLFAAWVVSGSFAAPPPLAAAPLSTAAPILAQMAAQAKNRSLDQAERLEALQVLAQWHTAEVTPALLDLLQDPGKEIRSLAARGLGWPGNTAALAALQGRALDTAEDATVRAAAVEALVRIGDASVRPMLVRTTQDPQPLVREEALRGLIDSPLQRPTDRLALATRSAQDGDLNPVFRVDAVRVLTDLKDPTSVPVLLSLLENGPRIPIVFPPPDAPQAEILRARYKQMRDVRAWAARGLGELGDRSTLPALVKATEDGDDAFLRYVATGVLAAWRACGARPAFLRLLGDRAPEVQVVAMAGVGVCGDRSDVDAVAAKLSDKAAPVRHAAVSALASLGGETARQRLEAARATETQPEVQRAMDEAIAKLKKPLAARPHP